MDDQGFILVYNKSDHHWLQGLNSRLKKLGEKECPNDLFEFFMDQLEKEWFDLVNQS